MARLESGAPGTAQSRVLAKGEGWQVADVICTSGPQDRRFEEPHKLLQLAYAYEQATNMRKPPPGLPAL